jgi:hypothetical protein
MTAEDSSLAAITMTAADCTLDGATIDVAHWEILFPEAMARIVGQQSPGGSLESADDFVWRFAMMDISHLRHATEDGEEPEGGWEKAHARHILADEEAVKNGSPEYAGRAQWLERVWGEDTRIYPLYVVHEDGAYRLLDGYHRLAGAFHFPINPVAVLIGEKRTGAH